MTYRVAPGPSRCGLHPVAPGRICHVCEQAHAANEDALRDVTPKPAAKDTHWKQRTPEAVCADVRKRREEGASLNQISRDMGLSSATVAGIVGMARRGKRKANFKSEQTKRAANDRMWGRSSTKMREEQRATPLPRGVRV